MPPDSSASGAGRRMDGHADGSADTNRWMSRLRRRRRGRTGMRRHAGEQGGAEMDGEVGQEEGDGDAGQKDNDGASSAFDDCNSSHDDHDNDDDDDDGGYMSAPEYNDHFERYFGMQMGRGLLASSGLLFSQPAARSSTRSWRKGSSAALQLPPLVRRQRELVRKMLTGSEEWRVRDFVKEWVRMPRIIRTRDKFSFVFGVLGLCLTEAIAVCRMEQFWAWYTIMMIYLLSMRVYLYSRVNMQYFLIDFCYFTCVSCMIAIFISGPADVNAFQTVFALANGPVLGALIVWRNSLVFHSIDKITTVYIHCLPSLLMWCWRWYGMVPIRTVDDILDYDKERYRSYLDQRTVPEMTVWNWLGLPLIAYCVWQTMYLLITEYWDREKLESNPKIQTSLRWMADNEKMASHRVALYVMRKLGLMRHDERFDPSAIKTKAVMVTFQLVFTLLMLLPIKLMYDYYWIHSLVMMYAYINCVWNGASYYIEVFAEQYLKQVERMSKAADDEYFE